MRITILGAGNGAMAAAAHMSHLGHVVRMFNRSPEKLADIAASGRIAVSGALGEREIPVAAVAADIEDAVVGAELIMLVVPTTAHEFYARAMAPYLPPDALILCNPGHTGGALHVAYWLRREEARPGWVVGEINDLTYITRIEGNGRVGIYNIGDRMLLSAFPGKELARITELARKLYPGLEPRPSVLHTSFSNLNAVLHPPGMLMNAGWIQHTGGDFYYYYEGTTQAIADGILALDRERVALAATLGISVPSFLDAFYTAGHTTEAAYRSGDLSRVMKESAPNRTIKSPPSLQHRYVQEDVGMGLVPWAALGDLVGVDTPAMDAFVQLASIANRTDYRREGLSLDRMGLAGVTIGALESFLYNGSQD